MTGNIADIVVSFIRTQEEADRLLRHCELVANAEEAVQCRRRARILKAKADRLLARYRFLNR